MQGILIVNKPKGMTSHDVVSFARRTFGMRRIGHTGTLDPDAEGVLPILLGNATKLSDLLTAEKKSYTARVRLGVATDTYDISGKILESRTVNVSQTDVQALLKDFIGEQLQIPPMYSAIKINGKKLYQLARQGLEVERRARNITINRLTAYNFAKDNTSFSLDIDCSKGTYIRTLCHDIGQRLGCGACMESLLRTRTGQFTLENAYTLEEIEQRLRANEIQTLLLSVDDVLTRFAKHTVSEENALKIRNGLRLRTEQIGLCAEPGAYVRLYDRTGLFCLASVLRDGNGKNVIKIEKTFFS